MGFFDKPFDASKVEPATAFKPLPPGDYLCLIKSGELKQTKNRDGEFLALTLTVLAPAQYKNRQLTYRINVENKNPTCVEIGHRQLSAVCKGTGVPQATSPGCFNGKTATFSIKVEKRQDRPDELSNEVAGVVLPDDKKPATDAGGAPAGAASGAAPWEQGAK